MQRYIGHASTKVRVRLETWDARHGWCRLNEMSGPAASEAALRTALARLRDQWNWYAPDSVGPMRIAVEFL